MQDWILAKKNASSTKRINFLFCQTDAVISTGIFNTSPRIIISVTKLALNWIFRLISKQKKIFHSAEKSIIGVTFARELRNAIFAIANQNWCVSQRDLLFDNYSQCPNKSQFSVQVRRNLKKNVNRLICAYNTPHSEFLLNRKIL